MADSTMSVVEPYVSRIGYVRWLVCALLFAVVALNYTDRQVLSVLKPTLQQAYGWSETGYGWIGAVSYHFPHCLRYSAI